jgi:hypothetical protein
MMNGLDSTSQGESEGLAGFLHFTRILLSIIVDIIFGLTIPWVVILILFVRYMAIVSARRIRRDDEYV